MKPFEIGIDSKVPVLMALSIDGIGKILIYHDWKNDLQIRKTSFDSQHSQSPETNATPLPASETLPEIQTSLSNEDEDTLNSQESPMVKSLIDSICNCFALGDQTDVRVQLQIVKALGSAVQTAHPNPILHSTLLLKAVRSVYTLFLLSKNANVQVLAQTTVVQMVQTVFTRVVQLGIKEDVVAEQMANSPNQSLPAHQQATGSSSTADADETLFRGSLSVEDLYFLYLNSFFAEYNPKKTAIQHRKCLHLFQKDPRWCGRLLISCPILY